MPRTEVNWRRDVLKVRVLLDIETQHIAEEFFELVNSSFSLQVGSDEFSKVITVDGHFLVKSCYDLIFKVDSLKSRTNDIKMVLPFLWDIKAPSRILIFGWRLIITGCPCGINFEREALSNRTQINVVFFVSLKTNRSPTYLILVSSLPAFGKLLLTGLTIRFLFL